LCALAFFDDFAAGMSRYGVADLEALAKDTHKFEARYLDTLIGPYPQMQKIFQERSPINHASELSCPILLLQGSDDPIVPPSQSQQLVKALAEKDIPHAYLEFEGEGHGFRKQDNIIRALNAELSFYRQVLKIDSDEQLDPVKLNVKQ
jgi:dipeptidyl aminopeptidase/acylaminoacyl peptidase